MARSSHVWTDSDVVLKITFECNKSTGPMSSVVCSPTAVDSGAVQKASAHTKKMEFETLKLFKKRNFFRRPKNVFRNNCICVGGASDPAAAPI